MKNEKWKIMENNEWKICSIPGSEVKKETDQERGHAPFLTAAIQSSEPLPFMKEFTQAEILELSGWLARINSGSLLRMIS
jgi:hypothetical protein